MVELELHRLSLYLVGEVNNIKKLFITFIAVTALGCASFRGIVLPNSPTEVFETAEVAYVSTLDTATTYARTCGAVLPAPTVECDEFTVTVREVKVKAAAVFAVSDLIFAGLPQCDEVATPGCTSEQLLRLAELLNRLVVDLKLGGN